MFLVSPFCALRLACAVAFVAVAWCVFGVSPGLVPALYLAVVTLDLWMIDERQSRLPNAIVVPGMGLALWSVVAGSARAGQVLVTPLLWAAIAAVVFGAGAVGGAVGWGDVKLSIVLAAVGGLTERPAVLSTTAVLALGLLLVQALATHAPAWCAQTPRRAWAAVRIPFGPALLAAFWYGLAWPGG
jgi:prepilin signal peptidase PulO-like enzyme (type II secretory pathway)